MRGWILAALAAVCVSLTGCPLLAVGGAYNLVMAFNYGEGRRLYNQPYAKVAKAAERATGSIHLRDLEIARGARKTSVRGKDVDNNRVRIHVATRDDGRQAAVTVRVGSYGDYVLTKVFFDALNAEFGLPPDPPPPRPSGR